MKICLLTGASEPEFSTNGGVRHGLKKLGHEVWTVGPAYSYGGKPINKIADVELPDRPHIEYYAYDEVLKTCPWTPDFFLCVEPHGYFNGHHFIPSAFYATDQHRAGSLYTKVLREGNYDIQFIGQPNYFNLLKGFAKESHIVLPGFDERRFEKGPDGDVEMWLGNPIVDVSFIGQTGIAEMVYPYHDGMGTYATEAPLNLPTNPMKRYQFANSYSFDYAERAEYLIRLSRDFSVRMYTDVWKSEHFRWALQAGRVGFNHSILHDISIRCFEVMAAGRWLITDNVSPYVEGFLKDGINCNLYDSPYKVFFGNFDIAYYRLATMIEWALSRPFDLGEAEQLRRDAFSKHTWTKRAEKMVEHMERYIGSAS